MNLWSFEAIIAAIALFIEVQSEGKNNFHLAKGLSCNSSIISEELCCYFYAFKQKGRKHFLPLPQNYSCRATFIGHSLCYISWISSGLSKVNQLDDACFNLEPIWEPGFMDAISRLPPPGGTDILDIFRLLLVTCYHLSEKLSKEFESLPFFSLRINIILDADYEDVIGNSLDIHGILLRKLQNVFQKNNFNVDFLQIRKGSLKISFLLKKKGAQPVFEKETVNLNVFQVRKQVPKAMLKVHLQRKSGFIYHNKNLFLRLLRYCEYAVSEKCPEIFFFIITNSTINTEVHTRHYVNDAFANEINSLLCEAQHLELQRLYQIFLNKKLYMEDDVKEHGEVRKESHPRRIRRDVPKAKEQSDLQLKFRFQIKEPEIENGKTDEFLNQLKLQLARTMRVPAPSIRNLEISGTDVIFTLSAFNDDKNIMDDQSILEAADSLKTKIKGQKLDLSDLNGRMLMTSGSAYVYTEGSSSAFSLVILIMLCVTLLVMTLLVITIVYLARKVTSARRTIAKNRNQAYRKMDFGRDSSQSVGKYSYDSGVWLGPGPEPTFTVPDAPYYRPPTVDQIASTPRPVTAVRTRLKRNWNVDADRTLSTIPDDFARPFIPGQRSSLH